MIPIVNIHSHRKPTPREWCLRNAWLPNGISLPNASGYFYSVGVHPWLANKFSEAEIDERIDKLITHENLKAIGEIGLDRVNGPDFLLQTKIFEHQLEIAKKYNKPVIIHCVKSYSDLLSFAKKYNMPMILHDYNGNKETSKQLMNFENVYFSFGKLLFRDKNLATDKLKIIPTDKLFFETDTMNVRIENVYEIAANILGMEREELYTIAFKNFSKII